MTPAFDLSLYFVADAASCGARGVAWTAAEAARGGATLAQLRDKTAPDAEFADLARALLAALTPYRIPLLVNDRVEIACAIGAHGAHVGQGDMTAARARALLGSRAIIGVSVQTEAHVAAIDPSVVDYVGVGKFRPTATKPERPGVLGAEGAARIIALSPVPAVAIGGIDARVAVEAMRTGAAGVAVVSAICAAADPAAAAAELRAIVNRAIVNRKREGIR